MCSLRRMSEAVADRSRVPPAAAGQTAETDRSIAGPGRAGRSALVAVACVPVVVAAIRAIARDWFPIGDSAQLYTRAADVLTRHHPFLGSWTSASVSVGENMNNPGPLYDLLIAPFARLLPPGPGAALGVGAVNIASIIGISAASRRIGGWAFQSWMLVATAALAWSMGSELLIDIFQAHALLLPFLLFLILLVGCAVGVGSFVPYAVAVASLLIQTHITFAYILVLVVGITIAVAWRMNPSFTPHRPIRLLRSRSARLAVVVFVLLWAHSFWEQFFGEGRGNLWRLLSNASGGAVSVGWGDATRLTGSVLFPPGWIRQYFATKIRYGDSSELDGLPSVPAAVAALVVLAGVLASLAYLAARRGLRAHAAALTIAALSVPASVVAISRLTVGPTLLSPGHVRWLWPLAVFACASGVWTGIALWRARRALPSGGSWSVVAAAALVVGFSTANLAYLPNARQYYPDGEYAATTLRRVFPQLDVLRGHGPVFFRTANQRWDEPFSSAVMMRLQELGVEFRVSDEGFIRQLGPSRRADGSEQVTVFQIEGSAALRYDGAECRVALSSALSADNEARAAQAAKALAADIVNGDIVLDRERIRERGTVPEWVLDLVGGGDVAAAWTLVIDGVLTAWIVDGTATASDRPLTEQRLAVVAWWVRTTYALFADGLAPCPSPGQELLP